MWARITRRRSGHSARIAIPFLVSRRPTRSTTSASARYWCRRSTRGRPTTRRLTPGVSWPWYYGETLNLSPDGKTASLTPYPQKPTSNLRYAFDSANKPQQLAFSGIWDLPIGKGRKFATGVTGGADKI